jgi:hypothetical protein
LPLPDGSSQRIRAFRQALHLKSLQVSWRFFAANLSVIHHAEARILAVESEIQQRDWSSIIASGLFLHRLKTISIPKRSLFSKLFHIVIDAAVLLLLYTKVG